MSVSFVAVELAIGAVVLAAWVEARIGDRRPASRALRMAHAGAAFLFLQASSVALAHLIHTGTPRGLIAVLLFLLFLPALVYAFVAGLWLLRTLTEIARLKLGD